MAVCGDGMERLCLDGHASVTVLVRGDGLFLKKKELVYAACFAQQPSLQVSLEGIESLSVIKIIGRKSEP